LLFRVAEFRDAQIHCFQGHHKKYITIVNYGIFVSRTLYYEQRREGKVNSNTKSNYFKVLEKIIASRIANGVTQINMANHLNLSEGGYFKVEKGKTKLDLERLLEILEFLKISPEEFFKDIA
jgi:DNA-binding XRE family transcriptional regulator